MNLGLHVTAILNDDAVLKPLSKASAEGDSSLLGLQYE